MINKEKKETRVKGKVEEVNGMENFSIKSQKNNVL